MPLEPNATKDLIDRLSIGGTHGHVEESIDGDLLQLWNASFCEWRPIRNCTGRYTCREKKEEQVKEKKSSSEESSVDSNNPQTIIRPSTLDPLELIQKALRESPANNRDATDTYSNADTPDYYYKPYWNIEKFDPPPGRTDSVWVLPLDADKSVGIITYVKKENNKCEESSDNDGTTSIRYVHTLNSPSGFQRKLQAVNIQLET